MLLKSDLLRLDLPTGEKSHFAEFWKGVRLCNHEVRGDTEQLPDPRRFPLAP